MTDHNNSDQSRAQAPQREQDKGPRPQETLRDGAIKASIWRNEGENGPYFATSLSRSYSDKDGNTRDTNSFVGTDLLKVAELARGAYERSREMRKEAFRERRTSGPDKAQRIPSQDR